MEGPHKSILFVINPRSGRRKKPDRMAQIREIAEKNKLNASYFVLGKKIDARQLHETIREKDPHTVVAVGGDGTVSLVAGLIRGTPRSMGIIPAGSANGMARELGIPEDTGAAMNTIMEAKTIDCDLVLVNDSWLCMHLSDIGLNARLVKYFQQGPVRGLPGYALALVKALRRRSSLQAVIASPKGVKKVDALMVLFANASRYGTGATINHEGSLTDGLFEVVIVKKIGIPEIWKMFVGSRGFNPRHIELHHARSVVVDTNKNAHLQVDGEYLGKVKSVEARMLPEKLKVLVP